MQGVGYPNPHRSHFESMDIWHSADPKAGSTGWLARAVAESDDRTGGVPILQIGANRLPLAVPGRQGRRVSVNDENSFRLEFGGGKVARRRRVAV